MGVVLALLDMKDLRAMLQNVGENAKRYTTEYGNISAASVGAIQRGRCRSRNRAATGSSGSPCVHQRLHADGGRTRRDRAPPPHEPAYEADPLLDLDQTPAFDPTDPEAIPDFDLDQTLGA